MEWLGEMIQEMILRVGNSNRHIDVNNILQLVFSSGLTLIISQIQLSDSGLEHDPTFRSSVVFVTKKPNGINGIINYASLISLRFQRQNAELKPVEAGTIRLD